MSKSKIILATLISLQMLGSVQCGNENLPLEINGVLQASQMSELLQAFETIQKQYTVALAQFVDTQNYPDMSLVDFCNMIIDTIETYGQSLPTNLRNNLIEIINIKKNSTSTTQFRAGHVLFNDTMIMVIDLVLESIHEEMSSILKLGVAPEDIVKTKRALTALRKTFDNLKRNGDYCGIETTIDKLKSLSKQLEPIVLKNPIYVNQFKNRLDQQLDQAPVTVKVPSGFPLLMLLDYRISKNR